MQFKRRGVERGIFCAHTARGGQGLSGVVRHGGENVGARQQCTQTIELGNRQYHMPLAAELLQFGVDKPAQIASE